CRSSSFASPCSPSSAGRSLRAAQRLGEYLVRDGSERKPSSVGDPMQGRELVVAHHHHDTVSPELFRRRRRPSHPCRPLLLSTCHPTPLDFLLQQKKRPSTLATPSGEPPCPFESPSTPACPRPSRRSSPRSTRCDSTPRRAAWK